MYLYEIFWCRTFIFDRGPKVILQQRGLVQGLHGAGQSADCGCRFKSGLPARADYSLIPSQGGNVMPKLQAAIYYITRFCRTRTSPFISFSHPFLLLTSVHQSASCKFLFFLPFSQSSVFSFCVASRIAFRCSNNPAGSPPLTRCPASIELYFPWRRE